MLDIEIWPTSIAVPAGHRLGLTLAGRARAHLLPAIIPEGGRR